MPKPQIICYPNHQLPLERINMVLRINKSHKYFKSLKTIRFIGADSSILMTGGRGGISSDLLKTWALFDPILEADLWANLIEERIQDERLKQWVGSIVWWDRSHEANDLNSAAWKRFETRYNGPFRSTVDEFLETSQRFLTQYEIRQFSKRATLDFEIIPDKVRRARAQRAMEAREDILLEQSMEAIGYRKVKN